MRNCSTYITSMKGIYMNYSVFGQNWMRIPSPTSNIIRVAIQLCNYLWNGCIRLWVPQAGGAQNKNIYKWYMYVGDYTYAYLDLKLHIEFEIK